MTAVARDSAAVATWTIFSRLSGLVRVIAIGAILGPTYLGNTFLAMNGLPNLTYQFLAGPLLSSLLVPALVRHLDRRDNRAAERLAGGFLGVAVLVFGAVALAVVALGPLVLRVFSIGVGDPLVAAAQRRAGFILLALVMPQVLLYGIAGVASAVITAREHFGLPAAAPLLENLGLIITLAVFALVFGTGPELTTIGIQPLLLLGVGSTASVAAHALALGIGARRLGVRLLPRVALHDVEVRQILARAVPTLGQAGFNAFLSFAVLVVANRIAGGVVAFQIAQSFYYVPLALVAQPITLTLLPRLSRFYHARRDELFRDELLHGAALTLFLVLPAAIAIGVLSFPLARAVTAGEMASNPAGTTMLALALIALATGLPGEAGNGLGIAALYARDDPHSPFVAILFRTAVTIVGCGVAFALPRGPVVLAVVGIAVAAGETAGALHLRHSLRSVLPPGGPRLVGPAVRASLASVAMVPVLYLFGSVARGSTLPYGANLAHLCLAIAVGLATFLVVNLCLRSPELHWLRQAVLPTARTHDAPAAPGLALPSDARVPR